ncbi:hypothetical protein GLOTRDRAFT_70334 [Gloeophyllum trabeum ATCC 11539]|uniref:HMG box domain-containing protein n=1 Tax=Gloeophyllum trabeum (strain ATCC 11539 / FP-39264 / Madison 617) TaxID=670483 RepID=S7S0B8_GLOTA|nr:uncharacterized protein GLOTRDRAFT_70334 [Gloeophyllum trabeum ATCC 11539]EPQ59154.1 hypothetical protein GLOTRDRAFT_70334 [Gloeophyllum trabeum ATCC 11539]
MSYRHPSPPIDSPPSDSDQMLFGPLDLDDPRPYDSPSAFSWPAASDMAARPSTASTQYDYSSPVLNSDPMFEFPPSSAFDDNTFYFSHWLNESELLPSEPASAPIPIPAPNLIFSPHVQGHHQVKEHEISPPAIDFAALTLPSPNSPWERPHTADGLYAESVKCHSPPPTGLPPPSWAAHLWDTPNSSGSENLPSSVEDPPLSDDAYATLRQRIPIPRSTPSLGQVFHPSSAPSAIETRPPRLARGYSRRAESVSESNGDRDATVRKKRRSMGSSQQQEEPRTTVKSESSPQKSVLRPPKLAPSAWQLYFTDWIQRHQATSDRKLNVAQAAKEAGQEYAGLSAEEKEPYKRKSQALKDAREREYDAYIRSLTPDEIKRENVFRTAQRKAGKSRKGNIKDPNAPKKPLSAYFMFLQRIRSDPELVKEVFGDETETTKQSVLAAHKWRSMTDDERKPFLAQAEQEKMEYEAARRLYEEGTVGFETSINFSVLPGSPIQTAIIPRSNKAVTVVKSEPLTSSESESEPLTEDDGDHYMRA